jgi:hypothetical protein
MKKTGDKNSADGVSKYEGRRQKMTHFLLLLQLRNILIKYKKIVKI